MCQGQVFLSLESKSLLDDTRRGGRRLLHLGEQTLGQGLEAAALSEAKTTADCRR